MTDAPRQEATTAVPATHPDPAEPQSDAGPWAMFAGWDERNSVFRHVAPDARYPRAYGDRVIHRVLVTADPDGRYLGWLAAGAHEPVMIQAHPGIYRMQFAYGPDLEEKAGRGATLTLRIDPAALP